MKNIHNKICCIYNSGAHYRWPIFKSLADHFSIDFYMGPCTVYTKSIRTFNYAELPGFSGMLSNRRLFGKFYWQRGALRLIFKPYKQYLMLGEAYCLSSWIIAMLARISGRNTVCWTHGWYGREEPLKRFVSKMFYSMFNEILTYNDHARELLIKGGIRANKIHTLGNSLDSERHKELLKSLSRSDIFSSHFHNNHPVLLYCGRIQKVKRIDLMLSAAAMLKSEGVNVNMVIVGKDSENVGLQEVAKRYGVADSVWLYGPCYDDKVLAEIFYNAAVCVSPGNVGLTAVHSLSFGCPVVTHGNFAWQGPEFECIKPGVTGDFFRQDDAADLARAIKPWIFLTPEQRSATNAAAYAEVDAKWNVAHQIEVFGGVLISK